MGTRPLKVLLLTFSGLVILLGLISLLRMTPAMDPQITSEYSPSTPTKPSSPELALDESFLRVLGPIPLEFPQDLGAHREYLTEWWYYTGNLTSDEGRQFGFQLTFFRRGILSPRLHPDRKSPWATGQVYLAHLALSDIDTGQFIFDERITREAINLAGATGSPLKIWLYDWKIESTDPNVYQLAATTQRVQLSLIMEDVKGITLQGDQGFSPKGTQVGNASIYFSQTRLKTQGNITLDGRTHTVRGTSWMDHEFSTSALSENQVGWDWFALQLDNGIEIMVYTIRKANGAIDPFSSGKIIFADGSGLPLSFNQFEIQVLDTWQSPHSNAVYPSRWKISIPENRIELSVTPLMADQELNLSFIYWEGAVKIAGIFSGEPVEGRGYAELTGYAVPFRGDF